jgi:cobalt transporter subunit CbtB
MTATPTTRTLPATGVAMASPVAILAAVTLGAVLLFAAGFAQSETLHATAHDVRHANGLICH